MDGGHDDMDELPNTQIVDDRVLKDVVAYVEVRSTNDNRTKAICKELDQLGAAIRHKFTDDVTHVVFKEGGKRTKNKAQKKAVHFVSVLWVDSCKQTQEHVSERLYPAMLPDHDKSTPVMFTKLKKMKSMQPKDFDEDVANSAERCTRRKRKVDLLKSVTDTTPYNSPSHAGILVTETQPRSPEQIPTPLRLTIPDTPPSMRAKMRDLQLKRDSGTSPVAPGNQQDGSTGSEPLFRKLFNTSDIDAEEEDPLLVINKAQKLSAEDDNSDFAPVRRSSNRRKSLASVRFTCNDEVIDKPKRTSTRRKSIAVMPSSTCTSVALMPAEDIDLTMSEDSTDNKYLPKAVGQVDRQNKMSTQENSDVVEIETSLALPTKMKGGHFSDLLPYTSSSLGQKTLDGSTSNVAEKKKSARGRRSVGGKTNTDGIRVSDPTSNRGRRKSVCFTNTEPVIIGLGADSRPDNICTRRHSSDGKDGSGSCASKSNAYTRVTNSVHAVGSCDESSSHRSLFGKDANSLQTVGSSSSSVMSHSVDLTLSVRDSLSVVMSNSIGHTSTVRDNSSAVMSHSVGPSSTVPDNSSAVMSNSIGHTSTVPDNSSAVMSNSVGRSSTVRESLSAVGPSVTGDSDKALGPAKQRGSRRKLLLPQDNGPCSFLIEPSKHSDKVRPTLLDKSVSGIGSEAGKGQRRKVTTEEPTTKSSKKLKRGKSDIPQQLAEEVFTFCDDGKSEKTGVPPIKNLLKDVLVNDSLSTSTLQTTGPHRMSMSAVFGDDTMASSTFSYAPPRPSIDEFSFRKFMSKPKGRPRKAFSESSVGQHKNKSDGNKSSSDSDGPTRARCCGGGELSFLRRSPYRHSVVMTSLHSHEQDAIISIVKKIGQFVISDNVSDTTTHVVCGGPRRTLNLLYGVSRGCWILHQKWVYDSLDAERWLPEEAYEVTDWFLSVKTARIEKESLKENYKSTLFSGVGIMFVSQKTMPPRSHLTALLKLGGGQISMSTSKAQVIIGNDFYPDRTSVSPLWVLDCITQQKLQPMEGYLQGRPKRESSPEF